MASDSYDGENVRVEEYQWVGVVYPNDIRSDNSALITPLAYFDDIHNVWHALQASKPNRYFPNNGKVYVLAKDYFPAQIGQLGCFQVWLNPRAVEDDNRWHSRYMTNGELEDAPLVQVFDWTTRAEHLFELPDVLDQGIDTNDCFSQSMYIRYGAHIYGPLHLAPMLDGSKKLRPREYLQASNTGGPQLLLREYRVPEKEEIDLGIGRFLHENAFESPIGKSDWSQPQVVIKRVLKAGNELSEELEQDEQLVDRRISALARLSSQHGPVALKIEETTLQRAHYILEHQVARLNHLELLMKDLPDDHPLLQAARKQEIEVRKSEIDREIHQQLQIQQGCLQELRDESQVAENKLAEMNMKIQEVEEEHKQKQAELEEQERLIQERLSTSREEFRHMLADFQLVARLPPTEGVERPGNGQRTETKQAWSARIAISAHPRFFLNDVENGVKNSSENLPGLKWVEVASQNEVRSKDVKICAAALLAGLIPVTSGPAAFAALRSVARLIAGDRMCRVPVPLTALSPLELCGLILLEQSRFIPTVGGLADILLEARHHPEYLALVILEGIDRVPVLPVLAPLLKHYREVRRNIQQAGRKEMPITPLDLFHPQTLAADDPYQELASFIWPKNILLAATCDNDMSSLPLPVMCMPWLVRTEPALQERTFTETSNQSWQVLSEHWYAWEQENAFPFSNEASEVLPKTFDSRQHAFYKVMQMLEVQKTEQFIAQIWPQQFTEQE